jgi:hypothetical protein
MGGAATYRMGRKKTLRRVSMRGHAILHFVLGVFEKVSRVAQAV